MNVKLPKKVKIGCAVYDVKYPYKFVNNVSDYTGLHWSTRSSILVSNKYNDRERNNVKILETFMHETLHAIDYIYLNTVFEEHEINAMGVALTDILLANSNLNLEKEKLPKKLKVGPFYYRIEYPYTDEDNPEFLYFSDDERCIYFLRDNFDTNKLPEHIVKGNLLLLILCSIFFFYNIERETEERSTDNLVVFSKGILQTLVDNKIFSIVDKQRSVFRE